MKCLPLVLASLKRKPVRTVLTMLGVVVAFVLFGMLQGVNASFSATLARTKLDRLFVDSRFGTPLPLSFGARIAEVPGVVRIAENAFLRTYYQDPRQSVNIVATRPAEWLAMRPEYTISQAELDASAQRRNAAIISDWLARLYDWKVGDQFTVRSRPTPTSPSADWTFVVTGIMRYSDPTEELTLMLTNFAYYDEARAVGRGTVNRFLVRIDNPLRGAQISQQIDSLFATSGVPTRTQSEQEMGQAQAASIGDVQFFTHSIMAAVFFTLLIVTGNTMMESVRERRAELAVLKALGFSDTAVLMLVVAESVILCLIAALVGLALAAISFPLASRYVELTELPMEVVLLGVIVAIGVALVSSVVPAWRVLRLGVADALGGR